MNGRTDVLGCLKPDTNGKVVMGSQLRLIIWSVRTIQEAVGGSV